MNFLQNATSQLADLNTNITSMALGTHKGQQKQLFLWPYYNWRVSLQNATNAILKDFELSVVSIAKNRLVWSDLQKKIILTTIQNP